MGGAGCPSTLWITLVTTFVLVLFYSSGSAGIEFTLLQNKWIVPDVVSVCGVLLCQEKRYLSGENKIHTVTNLSVFKTVQFELSNRDSIQDRQQLLASVSSTQPKLEQVIDGMKMYGLLKDGQATLKIELSKQTDCLTEFTCQVKGVDLLGNEQVSYFRLLKQHLQTMKNEDTIAVPASIVIELLSLIQKQDVKLEMIEKTSEKLENNMSILQKSWEECVGDVLKQSHEKVESLKDIMIEKITFLERTLTEQINSLERSSQDKTLSGFRNIADKLCMLDSKLSAVDSNAIQEKVIKTMKTQTDAYISNFLNTSKKADDALSRITDLFIVLNSNRTSFEKIVLENYHELLTNLTGNMDKIFTSNENLTDEVRTKIVSFEDQLDLSLHQLLSITNKKAEHTLSALSNMTSQFNSTLINYVESTLTGFFMPESCMKNTPILLHPPSTPYPVIYRSEFPRLNTPLLCDTVTDGGGWIVIQRRSTGKVDFYRNWVSYKDGFGTLDNDFWLGNENIHAITSHARYELRVELKYEGQSKFALYDRFSIGGENTNYVLSLGTYSGSAGDSLSLHSGHKFSTYDKDNDAYNGNCARQFTGAWWYTNCHYSNLNGKWRGGPHKGLKWDTFTGIESAYFSEMKIRQVNP
ncbi:hypothetical protein RRG08_034249 [Elysia crispata]|uniref:Fibrinogen C-terminal domain-containing protein n=1 Tax=Elysia crispata TaxID=231223 RepID=A0AAE1A1Y6_9GAST|nr:hypothetical protein RRG08_034249 [Elysia crispata]